MASYLHPGVYVEEIPSGSKPIEGVATSTAVFVGATPRGEIDVPTLITSWDQYEGTYDGIRDTARDEPIDSMGYSVWAFFRNGGKKAYIMRLSGGGATLAEGYLTHPEDGTQLIRFEAVNEGAWGGRLRLTFTTTGTSQYALSIELRDQYSDANEEDGDNVQEERFTDLSLDEESPDFLPTRLEDSELVRATLVAGATDYFQGTSTSADLAGLLPVNLNGQTLNLSFDDGAEDVAVTFEAAEFTATATLADIAATIQDAVRTDSDTQGAFTAVARGTTLTLTSGTVSTESSVVASGAAAATLRLGSDNGGRELIGPEFLAGLIEDEITIVLAPGEDGSPPGSTQYDDAFTALRKYSVNIVCLPGQVWTADGNANIEAAESYAESMRTCMFLVDPQSDLELVDATGVSALGLETSTYGVLYYPWLEVSNPHYDSEKRPDRAKTVLVPPGGFAAGMWAKIDSTRGVWKAPAGTETALNGTIGAEFIVGDDEQDELNPLAVNCIRALNVAGLSARVIWGSRTLATKNKPEWRYVPVRRTAIFIEQSIYNGIQWAVFEPNDHRLWSSLRTNIDSFMNGLFRTGAFQGEKASSAYFVRCGLGDTMTQGDIDAGQVIVIVGFAPLKPAEFVIIRIQQKVGEQ